MISILLFSTRSDIYYMYLQDLLYVFTINSKHIKNEIYSNCM